MSGLVPKAQTKYLNIRTIVPQTWFAAEVERCLSTRECQGAEPKPLQTFVPTRAARPATTLPTTRLAW